MVAEVRDLDLVVTDSEMEALALENNLIKRHKPRYNVLLRDDKNHPYLKLTLSEEYPRLYVVRRPAEDGNSYGGPYIPASLGRKTAAIARKLFGIRSCRETLDGQRGRPCLQYQIKRCAAPCVADICTADDYRTRAEDARLFLEGRTDEVLERLEVGMHEAAIGERFETAAALRDQIRALERLEAPQKITTTELEERDLFGVHVEGERPPFRSSVSATGRSSRERRTCSTSSPSRSPFSAPRCSSSTRRGATSRGRSFDPGARRRTADRRVALGTSGESGDDPRPATGREAAPARTRRSQRRSRLRPRMEAPSTAVRGDPALAPGPARSRGRAGAHRVLRHLQHPGRRTSWRRWWCSSLGSPKKSDYRKFRVKGLSGTPDDFASMREVVGRRYRRLLEEGQGPSRPRPRRRRQGTARCGDGRPGGSRARRPAGGESRQTRRADLRAGAGRAPRPAAGRHRCSSSSSGSGTRPIASPSGFTDRRAVKER